MYSCAQLNRVTERFYSKIATFEWPFSRTLSSASTARPMPKSAQFCQVHFLRGTSFGVRSRSLLQSCLFCVTQSARKRPFKSDSFAVKPFWLYSVEHSCRYFWLADFLVFFTVASFWSKNTMAKKLRLVFSGDSESPWEWCMQ